MRARVWVHTAEEFQQWQTSQLAPASAAADTTMTARGAE
jgi:heme/copper-type cytochrome/quinol oxidase subunit 2